VGRSVDTQPHDHQDGRDGFTPQLHWLHARSASFVPLETQSRAVDASAQPAGGRFDTDDTAGLDGQWPKGVELAIEASDSGQGFVAGPATWCHLSIAASWQGPSSAASRRGGAPFGTGQPPVVGSVAGVGEVLLQGGSSKPRSALRHVELPANASFEVVALLAEPDEPPRPLACSVATSGGVARATASRSGRRQASRMTARRRSDTSGWPSVVDRFRQLIRADRRHPGDAA
jgi:hypothetical protein